MLLDGTLTPETGGTTRLCAFSRPRLPRIPDGRRVRQSGGQEQNSLHRRRSGEHRFYPRLRNLGEMMDTPTPSNGMLWTGRVLSALPALMMLGGVAYGFTKPPKMMADFSRYGYSEN